MISTNMEMLQKWTQGHWLALDSSDHELLIRSQCHVQRKQVHTLFHISHVPRTTIHDGPLIQTMHQGWNDEGRGNSVSKRNVFKLDRQIYVLSTDVPEIGNTKAQNRSRRKPTLLFKVRLAGYGVSRLHECSRIGNVHCVTLAVERVLEGTI